jgi:hypothetical protein
VKWFPHVHRRVINALVRKSELIQVEGTKKGREKDMSIKEVGKSLTLYRIEWRKRIHLVDHDYLSKKKKKCG